MRNVPIPSKTKRPAKPSYGLPSAVVGEDYIPHADAFGEHNQELYDEGKAWWSSREFVAMCNGLFTDWPQEKWGNSAAQYRARLDAGASNPTRREKAYRVMHDTDSGLYVMCSVEEAINFHDFGKAMERAALNAHEKEASDLKKAHYHLDVETQRKCEAQYIRDGQDVEAIIRYNNNPHLTLAEAAESQAQLGNGNGEARALEN